MHRNALLNLLQEYGEKHPEESGTVRKYVDFVSANSDCFLRSLETGHVTGSAWIINQDGSRCVLIHHVKLDRWLQPGGHADGCTHVEEVALKEAREETGLSSLHIASPHLFDLDIHLIPERKGIPAHYHYDARFLFIADEHEQFSGNAEVNNVAWISLDRTVNYTGREESVLRMVRKTKELFRRKKNQSEGNNHQPESVRHH